MIWFVSLFGYYNSCFDKWAGRFAIFARRSEILQIVDWFAIFLTLHLSQQGYEIRRYQGVSVTIHSKNALPR